MYVKQLVQHQNVGNTVVHSAERVGFHKLGYKLKITKKLHSHKNRKQKV